MRLARVLGAIGRGLISAGVIVLLFVAYQLWGTGLQHGQAQGSLENELEEAIGADFTADEESLAELVAASQDAIAEGQIISSEAAASTDTDVTDDQEDQEPDDGPTAVTDTGATVVSADFESLDRRAREQIVAKIYPDEGDAFARIIIPDINVDEISVEGVSVEDLRKGPGHYQSTPNPGQAGNSAIAGHRTTYGAPFHRVDELDPGDSIFVTTAQGTFHYEVLGFDSSGSELPRERWNEGVGYFIVSPSDTWVLDSNRSRAGRNLLTLTACHPKYSARQRIIVQAELVGEPVLTIPRDEAVDLAPLTIDAGESDERAGAAEGIPAEEQVIIGDDVAADDDPDVDADGNPIDPSSDSDTDSTDEAGPDEDDSGEDDSGEGDSAEDSGAADDSADDDAVNDDTASGAGGTDSGGADSGDTDSGDTGADAMLELEDATTEVDVSSGDAALASAQTPFSNSGGDPDDFGEGLNGDRTKIKPAIMWGISGGAIWLAAWFIGQRLNRKWTLYAFGLAPFALVLWSAFVNIDQALPSY